MNDFIVKVLALPLIFLTYCIHTYEKMLLKYENTSYGLYLKRFSHIDPGVILLSDKDGLRIELNPNVRYRLSILKEAVKSANTIGDSLTSEQLWANLNKWEDEHYEAIKFSTENMNK